MTCSRCDRPDIIAGLCAEHFTEADLESAPPVPPGVTCGWCAETAIVQTSCSAPACRAHLDNAMEQVGRVIQSVRAGWDQAVPVRPETVDIAVRAALSRGPRRIEDVPLP